MTIDNDYEVVKVFMPGQEVGFDISPEPHQTNGMPDRSLYLPDCDFSGIAKHYGFDEFQWADERILNLSHLEQDLALEVGQNKAIYRADWVTSLDVKAHRSGKVNLVPVGIVGVTRTRDDQIVVGVRGGKLTQEGRELYGRGFFGAFPGGSATWKEEYEVGVIEDTILREAREEMGNFGVGVGGVVGYVTNTGVIPSSNFVVSLKTDASLKQLQDVNTLSIGLRKKLLQRYTADEVMMELRSRGLPPDAWENEVLVGLPNNPRKLTFMISALKNSFTGSTSGALDAYVQHMWPGFVKPEF